MDSLSERSIAPQNPRPASRRSIFHRPARIAALTIAAAGAGYVAFLPDTYEASAHIPLPGGVAQASEIDHLLSQPVLVEAVQLLPPTLIAELRQSATDTLDITKLLERRITVSPAGDHGLHLKVSAAKPASALGLANALTSAYLAGNASLDPPLADAASDRLLPDNPRTIPAMNGKQQALYGKMAAALETRIQLESQAELVESLLAQDNFHALARDFDASGALALRITQLVELESERSELAIRLLPNHPSMRSINERIATLTTQLRSESRKVAEATRAAITAARHTETALETEFKALSATAEDTAQPIDQTVLTGSIPDQGALNATVTPRTKWIAPELGAGLGGGLVLLAQIGLLALPLRRAKWDVQMTDDSVDELNEPVEPSLTDEMEAAEEDEQDHAFADLSTDAFEVPVTTLAATEPLAAEAPPSAEMASSDWQDPESEPEPEPEPTPEPVAPPQAKPQPRIAIIPACPDFQAASSKANDLAAALHKRGKRVALIDAGSGLRSASAGISDLAAGRASFAEVIQPDETGALASIDWGRRASADLGAEPVRILLLALRQVYDAVIVIAGKPADLPQALLAMPDAIVLDDAPPADIAPRKTGTRRW